GRRIVGERFRVATGLGGAEGGAGEAEEQDDPQSHRSFEPLAKEQPSFRCRKASDASGETKSSWVEKMVHGSEAMPRGLGGGDGAADILLGCDDGFGQFDTPGEVAGDGHGEGAAGSMRAF